MQITLNNTLTHYGADSIYGSEIPLACSGIITKVNMIYFSIIIGLSQGLQPIVSFNYGAKKYGRVIEAYRLTLLIGTVVSIIALPVFSFSRGRSLVSSVKDQKLIINLRRNISEFICSSPF